MVDSVSSDRILAGISANNSDCSIDSIARIVKLSVSAMWE